MAGSSFALAPYTIATKSKGAFDRTIKFSDTINKNPKISFNIYLLD
jgi:hypothetical protein